MAELMVQARSLKSCTTRRTCKVTNCFKKHPTVLHTIPNIQRNNKVDKSTLTDKVHFQVAGDGPSTLNDRANAFHVGLTNGETGTVIPDQTGAGKPEIARAIIPVKVRSKETNKTIVTYAFLDNGSDSSFCTECLAEQLGVKGIETVISLTTMEKKNSIINSSIIQHLEVSDLDENCSIDLPLIYMQLIFLSPVKTFQLKKMLISGHIFKAFSYHSSTLRLVFLSQVTFRKR